MGITYKACVIIVTAEATSKSRLLKSSFQSIFPTIKVSGPYSNSGMTNSPIDGLKNSIAFFLLLVLQ